MFGRNDFIVKTILVWSLVTVALIESARQKKDVHHMIFLNESRRPAKSQRNKNQDHYDYHTEDRPNKSRKKPTGKRHKETAILDDSNEGSSYEEFLRPKPKSKRHPHRHTYSGRNYKRHNYQNHQNDHKKHHQDDHHHRHNHRQHIHKESPKVTTPNWIPMSSKELFGKDQHQYYMSPPQGYFQPVPMEITTPLPLEPINPYHFQSTIYPPLSPPYNPYLNQNSPQASLLGTVEPYKPFDYSVLEQKPQNVIPSGTFRVPEASSSNIVNVKHNGGKNGNQFSIIMENTPEEKEKTEEEKSKKRGEAGKNEEIKGQEQRARRGSRGRVRSKP